MTTFNEADHPRATGGKFAEKAAREPETSSFDMWFDRVRAQYDNATFEGRGATMDGYRAAAEVTRSGLVGVVVDETHFDREKNPRAPHVGGQTNVRVFDTMESAVDFARDESGDDAEPEDTFEKVSGDIDRQYTRTEISVVHPRHLPISVPPQPDDHASEGELAQAYVEASRGYARAGERMRAFEHNEPARQAMHAESQRWRRQVDELGARLHTKGLDLDHVRDEGDARITDQSGRILQRF